MEVNLPPLVYRGTREICSAVGLNPKAFSHYVETMGLPVFQIDGKRPWLALPADLESWVEDQRTAHQERRKTRRPRKPRQEESQARKRP